MPAKSQSRIVQARVGQNYANAISNTARFAGLVASRDSVELLQRHDSEPHTQRKFTPSALQGWRGLFLLLSRVVPGDRTGGPGDEGMARVERQPSPLNRCPRVVLFTKAGRCNIGLRKQSSVGSGNHCARMFKMRSESRRCDFRQRKPLPESESGVVCARSSTRARFTVNL